MKCTELPLHADLLKGLDAAGFKTCMPVQQKVLPTTLERKDVMVQSKTGSGKTAVFLITLLQHYLSKKQRDNSFGLVIAPTRELAVQIEQDARLLSQFIPSYRIGCFYGGVGYAKQDALLEKGLDVMIATPGRILDYQRMGKINFKHIDTFVIDEADRLFDLGFFPDIQKMFSMMGSSKKRQTMLFSATLSTKVRTLAWQYMNEPVEFEVQPEEVTVKAVDQELYHVAKSDKFHLFLRLMNHYHPKNALVFTNTKAMAIELSKRLNLNGYKTQYLMGDLPQQKRLSIINRMKSGSLKFLIATDVAARGLQIDDLELVVNYDLPEDYESYVHRIGRTARAGKSGKAVSLACEQYVYSLEAIEEFIKMSIPVVWVDDDVVKDVEDKSEHISFRNLLNDAEYRQIFPSRKRERTPQKPRPKRSKALGIDRKRVAKVSSQQKKRYSDIQHMDLDQRMALYKQEYSGAIEPKKKVVLPETKVKPKKKKRKKGIFTQLLGKGKKDA
ncbi:MAG: DEAD/DEAH box helicase [Sphaerochaetaceae bacterium]